jgi:predicted SAM-dependent methyltransferase
MKLNIGCGRKHLKGYVNVDIRPDVGADIVYDCSVFPYPWKNNTIDEIFTADFIEHISYLKHDEMFKEFYRILKPGGKITIHCPDILHLFNHYGKESDSKIITVVTHAKLQHFLFGAQDYPENFHKAGYTKMLMEHRLRLVGFRKIEVTEHMKAVARKPLNTTYTIL